MAAVAQCADRLLQGRDGCATTAGKRLDFLLETDEEIKLEVSDL